MAGMRHGITPVWASEIEKFPIEVTKQHFPNMKHLGDITKINGAEIEPVDVVTFGSPCQDLSVAGKRAGLDGERSGLFMEAVRIIREMRNATNGKYPRFAVWENVPGAFSSAKGNDFRAVLEEITESKIPMPNSGRWATSGVVRSNGIEAAWRVLDAQHWGVPQRRKRIFLVADFRGESAAEILFVEKGLRGDSTQGRKEGEGVAGSSENSTQRTVWGFIGKNSAKSRSIGETKNISPTLDTGGSNVQIAYESEPLSETDLVVAQDFTMQGFGDYKDLDVASSLKQRDYKDATDLVVDNIYKVRRLTPMECERLQGFPDNWTNIEGCSDTGRYKALGNSVAVPCVEFVLSGIALLCH